MKEVLPQFTYEATQLTFRIDTDDQITPIEADLLAELETLEGVNVSTTDTGHTFTADLQPLLKKDVYDWADGAFIEKLLGTANILTPYISAHDEVLGLSTIGHDGLNAHIYPSFQTWLEGGGITPEVLQASETAMYSVFGEPWVPPQESNHIVIRAGLDKATFDMLDYQETEEATLERTAKVELTVPWLQSLGNCACLSSDAMDRSIHTDAKYASLYKLKPHNIDNIRQVLSLVVGLGTLAAHAPTTFDETSLFKDVAWNTRTFPKD